MMKLGLEDVIAEWKSGGETRFGGEDALRWCIDALPYRDIEIVLQISVIGHEETMQEQSELSACWRNLRVNS